VAKDWTLRVYCKDNTRWSGKNIVRIGNDPNEEYVKAVPLMKNGTYYIAIVIIGGVKP